VQINAEYEEEKSKLDLESQFSKSIRSRRYTKNGLIMRRSTLEINVDILKALARYGPLKLTHIMYKANINCSVLKQCLESLIEQGLVEMREKRKKRDTYVITDKGRRAIRNFWQVDKALQITEDASKISPLMR
jgi:predicted transcriptional regulator